MSEVVRDLVDFIINSNYAHAILIFVFFIFVSKVLLYFFKHVLEKLVKKTKTTLDDKIVISMETPLVVLMVLVGILLASRSIFTQSLFFEKLIQSIMVIIVTFMFVTITNIVVTYWAKTKENEKNEAFHQEIKPLVKSLSKITLISISIVVILQLWGVQLGTTLASLGVVGVILGLSFQDTMKNIFGGISLIVDDSIHKKDIIRLENGDLGEVVEVNLRSTKIQTFDNEYLIIPNGVLSNSKIINLAEPDSTLRVTVPVSVAYGSNIILVKKTLLDVLKNKEHILKLPKREVRFVKMGDYSLDFNLLFFISDFRDQFQVKELIMTQVYAALRKQNIKIPFPSRTLYSGDESSKNIISSLKIKQKKTLVKRNLMKKSIKKKTLRSASKNLSLHSRKKTSSKIKRISKKKTSKGKTSKKK